MIDLAPLKAASDAMLVLGSTDWEYEYLAERDDHVVTCAAGEVTVADCDSNQGAARLIALAKPPTVVAICAELEAARADVETLRGALLDCYPIIEAVRQHWAKIGMLPSVAMNARERARCALRHTGDGKLERTEDGNGE